MVRFCRIRLSRIWFCRIRLFSNRYHVLIIRIRLFSKWLFVYNIGDPGEFAFLIMLFFFAHIFCFAQLF